MSGFATCVRNQVEKLKKYEKGVGDKSGLDWLDFCENGSPKRPLILALVSVNILSHVQTDYYFPAFIYGVDVSWRWLADQNGHRHLISCGSKGINLIFVSIHKNSLLSPYQSW